SAVLFFCIIRLFGYPQAFSRKKKIKWSIMSISGAEWELLHFNMLIGQFTHDIDPKKRLTLPAKWRGDLGKKVVVTTGLDTSLFVYPLKEWEKIAEKLSEMSFGNADSRHFNRFLLTNAFETDVDAQGRILIPDVLKDFAHLDGKIVLA